jgi:hypothetical protein
VLFTGENLRLQWVEGGELLPAENVKNYLTEKDETAHREPDTKGML